MTSPYPGMTGEAYLKLDVRKRCGSWIYLGPTFQVLRSGLIGTSGYFPVSDIGFHPNQSRKCSDHVRSSDSR